MKNFLTILFLLFFFFGFAQNPGIKAPTAGGSAPNWKSTLPQGIYQRIIPFVFDPSDVANMKARYISDSVVKNGSNGVTNWKDISGHGFDMTANHNAASYPTWHASGGPLGGSYIRAESGFDIHCNTISQSTPYQVYYIVKNNSFKDGKHILGLDGSNSSYMFQNLIPAGQAIRVQTGGSSYFTNSNAYSTNYSLISLTMADQNNGGIRLNNNLYAYSSILQNSGYNLSLTAMSDLGLQPYYTVAPVSVVELIVYSGLVSVADDASIRNYLTQKYGITTGPSLLGIGDSNTQGGPGVTNADTSSFMAYIGRDSVWPVINYGYGGTVAVTRPGAVGNVGHNGTDVATFVTAINSDWSNVRVIFQYGTNDVATDATWVNGYKAAIQQFLDKGVPANHIVVCTKPATATGGYASLTTQQKTTYDNTLVVATAMGVIFYDNITYESSTWVSANIYTDGIHMTNVGSRVFATGEEAVML